MERKMKDSGIPWIGEIPEHWNVKRGKSIFKEVYRDVRPEDGTVTCFRDGEVTLRTNRRTTGFTESDKEIGYHGVRVGDLVIHQMDAFAGSIGISDSNGKCSPICIVCRPLEEQESDLNYYCKLLRVMAHNGYIQSLATGIRERSTDFRYKTLVTLLFPVPPLAEQERIASYLDEKCGEIDELIDVEQQIISDLESYRQAVITEAVIHGLNPDAPTKETSIPWISAIPERWGEIRLKFLSRISTGDKDTIMANDEGEYPFFVRSPKVERINSFSYDGEAILMAGDGVGAGRVFHHFIGKFDWHQRVYNLHDLNSNIYGRYLFYFMLTNFHKLIDAGSAKSTVDSVRLPMLTNFITLAPPLAEQQEIAEYLDGKCSEIDGLIKVKQEKIETLKQYRQSLIFEAVTGKTDLNNNEEV